MKKHYANCLSCEDIIKFSDNADIQGLSESVTEKRNVSDGK